MTNVLIIVDDTSVSSSLQKGLAGVDFTIDILHSSKYEIALDRIKQYDCIMIDSGLTYINCYAICKFIRHAIGDITPIFLLTSSSSSTELFIKGIEAGATDFLSIGFPFNEILTRFTALIQKHT